jgi:hypothetical protein
LSSPFGVFVEGNDRSEDGTIELFEFIGIIVRTSGVAFGNIEMTLSVCKFL